jgi:hypothetical protein
MTIRGLCQKGNETCWHIDAVTPPRAGGARIVLTGGEMLAVCKHWPSAKTRPQGLNGRGGFPVADSGCRPAPQPFHRPPHQFARTAVLKMPHLCGAF